MTTIALEQCPQGEATGLEAARKMALPVGLVALVVVVAVLGMWLSFRLTRESNQEARVVVRGVGMAFGGLGALAALFLLFLFAVTGALAPCASAVAP